MRWAMNNSGKVSINRPLVMFLLVILAAGVSFRLLYNPSNHCSEPLTYRIGSIDERFGLSESEVRSAVNRASQVWASRSELELFREDPDGAIEISFVYDYRQEASDKLKGMGGNIENTKGSYDALKSHLKSMESDFMQKKSLLDSDFAAYNSRMEVLKAQNDAASQKGGGIHEFDENLKSEMDSLDSLRNDLMARQEDLNRIIETMNSLVVVINEIAYNLNLDVVKYNNVGEKLGKEFSEGLYERKNNRRTITIYHFNNDSRLVRILAHELGHALGLEHSDNPQALMYRLNQSDSLELSPDDIAALQARCEKE